MTASSGLPREHLELIVQLEEMEAAFLEESVVTDPALIAQALTCLAHDYIQIGLEEKGHLLLVRADEILPGYHKNEMAKQARDNPDFALLVESLYKELLLVAAYTAAGKR